MTFQRVTSSSEIAKTTARDHVLPPLGAFSLEHCGNAFIIQSAKKTSVLDVCCLHSPALLMVHRPLIISRNGAPAVPDLGSHEWVDSQRRWTEKVDGRG